MRKKNIVVFFTISLLAFACSKGEPQKAATTTQKSTNAAQSTANNDTNTECGHILETYCTSCHQTSRICQKLGKKSESQWNRTIKRMIRHGAKINKVQRAALAKCLGDQDKAITDRCGE